MQSVARTGWGGALAKKEFVSLPMGLCQVAARFDGKLLRKSELR